MVGAALARAASWMTGCLNMCSIVHLKCRRRVDLGPVPIPALRPQREPQDLSHLVPTCATPRCAKRRTMRTVVWFSCGAASAVAAKLAVKERGLVKVVYCDPGSEHPDSKRFLRDVEEWIGQPITVLKSDKYIDTWDVWNKTKYLVGPSGAQCTVVLKKRLRQKFERPDDEQVFGFTKREEARANRFREQNPEVDLWTPLIEQGITKRNCHQYLALAGIEPHAMYRLGYHNANCIACPKGGMGYWNRIRVDFPEEFERMAKLERELGVSINRDQTLPGKPPVYLDELDPNRGNYRLEPAVECGVLCHSVLH